MTFYLFVCLFVSTQNSSCRRYRFDGLRNIARCTALSITNRTSHRLLTSINVSTSLSPRKPLRLGAPTLDNYYEIDEFDPFWKKQVPRATLSVSTLDAGESNVCRKLASDPHDVTSGGQVCRSLPLATLPRAGCGGHPPNRSVGHTASYLKMESSDVIILFIAADFIMSIVIFTFYFAHLLLRSPSW